MITFSVSFAKPISIKLKEGFVKAKINIPDRMSIKITSKMKTFCL